MTNYITILKKNKQKLDDEAEQKFFENKAEEESKSKQEKAKEPPEE